MSCVIRSITHHVVRLAKLYSTTNIGHSLRTRSRQAVARRFNRLQQEATVRGTQSLIDARSVCGRNNNRRTMLPRRSRPQSSGGRMASRHKHGCGGATTAGASSGKCPALLAPPFLSGATLHLQDGGGFTTARRPLLCAKGLPSGTQVNEGLARRVEASRSLTAPPLALKTSIRKKAARGGGEQAAKSNCGGDPIELGTAMKEDFAARVARRDDILQVSTNTCLFP